MPKHDHVLFRGKNGDLMVSYPQAGSWHEQPSEDWEERDYLSLTSLEINERKRFSIPEAVPEHGSVDTAPDFRVLSLCDHTYHRRVARLEIKLWR